MFVFQSFPAGGKAGFHFLFLFPFPQIRASGLCLSVSWLATEELERSGLRRHECAPHAQREEAARREELPLDVAEARRATYS